MKTIFPTQWRGATEGSALSPAYLKNFIKIMGGGLFLNFKIILLRVLLKILK